MCTMNIQVPIEVRSRRRIPGTGANRFELQCRCWEMSLSPLQEQRVLLTPGAISPSPQHLYTRASLGKNTHHSRTYQNISRLHGDCSFGLPIEKRTHL